MHPIQSSVSTAAGMMSSTAGSKDKLLDVFYGIYRQDADQVLHEAASRSPPPLPFAWHPVNLRRRCASSADGGTAATPTAVLSHVTSLVFIGPAIALEPGDESSGVPPNAES